MKRPLTTSEKEFFADVFPVLSVDGWHKEELAGYGQIKYRLRLADIDSVFIDDHEYWMRLELGVVTSPNSFRLVWMATGYGKYYSGHQLSGSLDSARESLDLPALMSRMTAEADVKARAAFETSKVEESKKFEEEYQEQLRRRIGSEA